MSRINTNVESLIARRAIGINVGCWKWDVGCEKIRCFCSLTSAIRHRTSDIDYANRADTIVAVADGGLQEVSSLNSLQVARENVTAAGSAIRDADFAVETSYLTRAQILVSSSISVL